MLLAPGAVVPPRHSAGGPLLHPTFKEFQIDLDVAHLFSLCDFLALTLRTCLAFEGAQSVDPHRGLSVFWGNGLQVGVSAYEDPLTLVIEVGHVGDGFKIIQGVLFWSIQLPARSVVIQFFSSSGLERRQGGDASSELRWCV